MTDATKAIHAARTPQLRPAGTLVVEPIVQLANFGLSEAVIDDLRSTGGLGDIVQALGSASSLMQARSGRRPS